MILTIGRGGCFLLDRNLVETKVPPYGIGRALQGSTAVLLRATPESAGLTAPAREIMYQALTRYPFYAALEPEELRQWLASGRVVPTIYDRSVGPRPLPDMPWLENITVSDLDDPALTKLIITDLAGDLTTVALPAGQYRPEIYWEERAKILQRSARGVSLLSAPRIWNKLRYVTQHEILEETLSDYSRQPEFSAIKPNLIDVGCGIGRLYPICSKHVRYFGTDVSDTMVDTARGLFPHGRFLKKAEMETAVLPRMDALLTVTVLHHNPPEKRREILEMFRSICSDSARIFVLEDVATPAASAVNMYPLSVRTIVDEISSVFHGSASVVGLRTVAYKPAELLLQAVLLEVEVLR